MTTTTHALTAAQTASLQRLCDGYRVTFDAGHYFPQFDLPTGWVGGWVGGRPGTIYVGVSPEGDVNS